MIDESLIKANYEAMTDSQLQHLAVTEGHELTPIAKSILQKEFFHRGLDISAFEEIQRGNALTDMEGSNGKQIDNQHLSETAFDFILNEKEKGHSTDIIRMKLIATGMEENLADRHLAGMEAKANSIAKSFDNEMIKGVILIIAGIIIQYLSKNVSAAITALYVMSWAAILFGIFKFFKALTKRGKYSAIIKTIEEEKALLDHFTSNSPAEEEN